MVVPLVIAGAIVGSAVVSAIAQMYTTYKSTGEYDKAYNYTNAFYNGASAENERYFEDYIRKHHISNRDIRYPYRTGYNFDMSKVLTSNAGLNANSYNRYNSIVQGGSRVVGAGASGYRIAGIGPYRGKPITDVMYG